MNIPELCLLLKSATSVEEIDKKREEIRELMPRVGVMFDYDQNNHAHQYDLWMHSLHTVMNLPRDLDDDMLYLAALLHDIGKPDAKCRGKRKDDTDFHFYGHPEKGHDIIKYEVIPSLTWFCNRYDRANHISKSQECLLLYYVKHHDDPIHLGEKCLQKHLKYLTLDEFKHYMFLHAADAQAHIMIPIIKERARVAQIWSGEYANEVAEKIEKKNQPI